MKNLRDYVKVSIFILFFAGTQSKSALFAQDSTFVFTAHSRDNYTPTYIGNGYLSLASTPLGCDPAESFMAGVFDEGKEDISRIAALPEWNEVDFNIGNKWFNKSSNEFSISDYQQTIDMYDGILNTSFIAESQNKSAKINIEAVVCRDKMNMATIKFQITPNYNGRLELIFPVKERTYPKRLKLAILKTIEGYPPDKWPYVWYPGFIKVNSVTTDIKNKIINIRGTSEGRGTKIYIETKIDWLGKLEGEKLTQVKHLNSADFNLSFSADSGKTYTFYKYIYAEKGNAASTINTVVKILDKLLPASFNMLLDESKSAWHQLWDTDIIIDGDPKLQKVIHSFEYYLLSSCNKDAGISIGPMGLASAGYYGHIFWDADTWMMPGLLLMHPEFAKNIVDYRYKNLNAAIQNAKLNHWNGAMYPWEGDDLGKESIPYFAIQNATNEIHVTGDVALAQWQYFQATGDTTWLRDYGSKVIYKIADFWTGRVIFNNDKKLFEIKNVVSVDEGLIGINNDIYTNSVAQKALQIAVSAAKVLKENYNKKWDEIAGKMLIPYDPVKKYNPTYENAPVDQQGSVSILLQYPLNMKQEVDVIKNNLNYSIDRIINKGHSVMMGETFLPIIASEINDSALFSKAIPLSYEYNLKPPYNAITETPDNMNYNFLTGAGGFLQQVIFGYTGLRITDEGLTESYKPMLPNHVKKLILRNFKYRGATYDFIVMDRTLMKIKK